jgi:hypothetical protein
MNGNCGKGAPWVGNTLGKDYQAGIVPPPWTSVAIANGPISTVSVWGREYSFGDVTALPNQIASQGQMVLAAPVALQVIVPGNTKLKWKAAPGVQSVAGNAVAAHVERSATAEYNGSAVSLASNATVEYDGFVWTSISLAGLAGIPVDINLEIPLRKDVALYTHRPLNAPPVTGSDDLWHGTRGSYSGYANWRASPNGLSDWVGSFIPYWWLGDNDVGLTWLIEDAHAWPNWHGADPVKGIYPIELQYEGNKAVMRLRLLRNQLVPPGWSFEFGLQTTPVKLPTGDFHNQRWRARSTTSTPYNDPLPGAGATRIVEVGGQGSALGEERAWTVAFGYPELDPSHQADYAAVANSVHALGGKLVQYTLLTDVSDGCPEWPACGSDWQALPNKGGCYQGFPAGASLCHTNPESSFADLIVWRSNAFMENPGVDGFYHDQTVLDHILGWTDPVYGQQPMYPIRGYRDLYRRIYTQAKKGGGGRFLFGNIGGAMHIPVLAYEDGYLDGEQLLQRLAPPGKYIERYVTAPNAVLTLDEFRAEFMGRQWGLVPFFYPKSDPFGGGAAATDEFLALLMLHNVGLFGDYADAVSVTKAYKILDGFPGFVSATFIPYFRLPAPVHVNAANVYGSVYLNGSGHGLLALANFNNASVSVSIKLDASYFPTISKLEALTPSTVPVSKIAGEYKMDLPGHGAGTPGTYKLLHIYP